MARNRAHLTPHSKLLARGCVDGRSREGRYLAAVRAEMRVHLGGELSASQRVLVERIAWLSLHVMLLDEKVAGGSALSPHDQRSYLAFSNALVRASKLLGQRPVSERKPSLVAQLAAAAAAEHAR